VGVVAEAVEELDDVGVDVGVVADVLGPLVELRPGRELAFRSRYATSRNVARSASSSIG
jgi:hypothetical protein